ncbi:MAG: NADH-quinone oxidoreductase subunit N [Candidatus Binatia bacterium]
MAPLDLQAYAANWQVALPGLVIAVAGLVVMALDAAVRRPNRGMATVLGVGGMLAAIGTAAWMWGNLPVRAGFQGTLLADRWALFFVIVIATGAAASLLLSADYLREHDLPAGEYVALVLLSTAGMAFMVAANDLIVVFVALEIMSVAVYVLAGMLRGDPRSGEAALKYFLLGAFASAFLLYGIAFLYGATGSTRLDLIAQALARDGLGTFAAAGIALLLVGFGFKVALAPFHVWTPDVYEGAPTAVTAFMAVGVKAAGFAALARVFTTAFGGLSAQWTGLLWVLAVLTMTIGNVTAVTQQSVKRMLAYSSIAHAGYALVGVVVPGADAGAGLLFYLAAYTVMNIGAFGVLLALGRRGAPNETLRDLHGVGFRHPVLGLSMTVFMLSLAGVPPTVGFAGKFYLFGAAVDAGYVGLAVVGVLNSLISMYYYLGVIVHLYMVEGETEITAPSARPALLFTIVLALVGTLALGIFPGTPMWLARVAAGTLR